MNGFIFCEKTISFFKDKIDFFDFKNQNYFRRPYLVACSACVTDEIRD